ncbi:GCG_CRPN prefix-to-repeats domain-containing protein [Camelimonas abortus]|uniref:GCG_CRPN prefix-to-repeats domain-containing protein n=1 Tax=Camelimonas abortus TaxID=1017184 RepID=UPI0035E77B73
MTAPASSPTCRNGRSHMTALKRLLFSAFASAALVAAAEAAPAIPAPHGVRVPGVELVAQGCGPGWARDPWGYCRPYRYLPPPPPPPPWRYGPPPPWRYGPPPPPPWRYGPPPPRRYGPPPPPPRRPPPPPWR